MPPRTLLLHPALAPYRVDLFNALSRRLDLRLALLQENVVGQAFDQERLRALLGFEPRYLTGGLTVAGRTLRTGIGAEIRAFRPEVVVAPEFGAATLAAVLARAAGTGPFALLVQTDDNPASVERDTLLHRLGRRLLLPRADALLTCSEEASALYRERFGATQPVVASALVQEERAVRARLDAAGPAARALAETRGLLGKRVLLYVGRLAPEKRVDRLIAAFARVRAALPDTVLALVGDGPERQRLEALVAASGSPGAVVLAGRLEGEALHAWYRLGSVFALASEYEPWGAVVNEALLAGMPAVVSDRAGARVLVREGRSGAVVDASRPEALGEALATWLARQPALSAAQLDALRPSLMESTFGEAVEAYLAGLDAALAHRRGLRGL